MLLKQHQYDAKAMDRPRGIDGQSIGAGAGERSVDVEHIWAVKGALLLRRVGDYWSRYDDILLGIADVAINIGCAVEQ